MKEKYLLLANPELFGIIQATITPAPLDKNVDGCIGTVSYLNKFSGTIMGGMDWFPTTKAAKQCISRYYYNKKLQGKRKPIWVERRLGD